MNTISQLYRALGERILILDGAMGTMLQQHHLSEADFRGTRFADWPCAVKGNLDLLSLTQPELIADVHRQYLDAGADIIETNSFSGTTIAMADYRMEDLVYELNFAAAKLAREACDAATAATPARPRFVAGAMGPTNKTASMSPDVNNPGFRAITFEELLVAYRQQAEALLDGGVDILLVETVFDTLNAKAALFAIDELQQERSVAIPVMVSGTITDASGRMLSGQTADAFLISVSHVNLLSIGFNCALGAKQLLPYLRILADNAPFFVSAHPNAGLPNAFGEYDETPATMAAQIKTYAEERLVNIVGGCCGTTPAHIRAIAEAVAGFAPRTSPIYSFNRAEK